MDRIVITDGTRIAITYGTSGHKIYSTIELAKEGFNRPFDQAIFEAIAELERCYNQGSRVPAISGVWFGGVSLTLTIVR